MDQNAPKTKIRKAALEMLSKIDPDTQLESAQSLTNHLLLSPFYQSSKTILVYASLPSEISLDPLIRSALEHHKRVCIPQINWNDKTMHPQQIRNLDTDLQIGRYDVRTPLKGCPSVEPNELDLILIPGLAFDRKMNRLGRGAGFYDRFINELHLDNHRPTLMGVCYDLQIIDCVPTEPHDHQMDRLMTQSGLIEPSMD